MMKNLIFKHYRFHYWIIPILLTISATVSAQSPKNSTSPVYVIVHGAWGGSWAFKKVDSLMTAQGAVIYRPSLTGQGERVHLASPAVGLRTHIDDVVNMILFEELRDIILVGHSYGGMVITGVADRVPGRIRRLVYLDAFVPNDGESVMTVQGQRGEWIERMVKDEFIIPSWVKPDQKVPKDVPQSLKTFTEQIVLKNVAAKQLPATYILTVDPGKKAEEDTFFASSERARQRGWTMREMKADHNPHWSVPEALVELLLREQ